MPWTMFIASRCISSDALGMKLFTCPSAVSRTVPDGVPLSSRSMIENWGASNEGSITPEISRARVLHQ